MSLRRIFEVIVNYKRSPEYASLSEEKKTEFNALMKDYLDVRREQELRGKMTIFSSNALGVDNHNLDYRTKKGELKFFNEKYTPEAREAITMLKEYDDNVETNSAEKYKTRDYADGE